MKCKYDTNNHRNGKIGLEMTSILKVHACDESSSVHEISFDNDDDKDIYCDSDSDSEFNQLKII